MQSGSLEQDTRLFASNIIIKKKINATLTKVASIFYVDLITKTNNKEVYLNGLEFKGIPQLIITLSFCQNHSLK